MSETDVWAVVAEQSPNKLCERCRLLYFDTGAIVDAPPPEKFRQREDLNLDEYGVIYLNYSLHDILPDLPKLSKSHNAGCRLCLFLKEVIIAHIPIAVMEGSHPKRTNVTLKLIEYHPDLGTVQFGTGRESWLPLYIEGKLILSQSVVPVTIHVRHRRDGYYTRFPDPDPLFEPSTQWMKTCLRTCSGDEDANHSECSSTDAVEAPLRLLNITNNNVWLEDTNNKNIPYCILSYCWGPSKVVEAARTVLSNLQDRLKGFPTTTLPQTLQDSIALARRLDASHIWIDALCIVQDSGEWIQESQRMMQYYEMASFTITPIQCSGAEQGFLQNRPKFVSDIINWPGSLGHFQFHFPKYNGVKEYAGASSSPWASRGWTFQERLLSSRMIFIGEDEVVFRCRAGYSRHHKQESIRLEQAGKLFLPLTLKHAEKSNEWNSVSMIRDKWYQLVSEYSERTLTQQSDKLIALSGVASKISQLIGSHDKYLDGFWESDLWHGLTWSRIPVRGVTPRPTIKSDHFPSWSWCCMNQPLIWQDGTGSISDGKLIRIIQDDSRSVGKVRMLIVESWVCPVQVLATQPPKDFEVIFYLDELSKSVSDLLHMTNIRVILLTAYLDGDDQSEWLLNPAAKPHDVCGMIIEETQERYESHIVYKRLGVVNVSLGLEFESLDEDEHCGDGFDKGLAFIKIPEFEKTEGGSLFRKLYSQKEVVVLA